jgi:UPF0755 protein
MGPSLEDMGIAVRGVNAPAFENFLDGPVSNEIAAAGEETANFAVVPVEDKRLAQTQESAARFGLASQKSVSRLVEDSPARVRVVDASEGTNIDPLLNRKWDLNSVQTIPALR